MYHYSFQLYVVLMEASPRTSLDISLASWPFKKKSLIPILNYVFNVLIINHCPSAHLSLYRLLSHSAVCSSRLVVAEANVVYSQELLVALRRVGHDQVNRAFDVSAVWRKSMTRAVSKEANPFSCRSENSRLQLEHRLAQGLCRRLTVRIALAKHSAVAQRNFEVAPIVLAARVAVRTSGSVS